VKIGRRETVAVALGVALVIAAFVVPHLRLGVVTPLIHSTPRQIHDYADTAPLFGWWKAHVGWGSIAATAIGIAAVLRGPSLARRLPWRVRSPMEALGSPTEDGISQSRPCARSGSSEHS